VGPIENPKCSLRSGELSRAAGVSTDTLRHYEQLGLLKKPSRTKGGYRVYHSEALDRVFLVRNALASGFTLQELSIILRVRDTGGVPCQQVAELAREKVSELGVQIAQLTRLRDSLRLSIREWDHRLKKTPRGERANLLESLSRERTQRAANTQGETHEAITVYRLPGDTVFRLRSKRNVLPHARAASPGI
jgi:DNA-binding transcriptional MerR regulator